MHKLEVALLILKLAQALATLWAIKHNNYSGRHRRVLRKKFKKS